MPALDAPTLFFAIALSGWLMAGIAHSSRRALPHHDAALRLWSGAMLCAGAAFMLFFLRGHAPWFLSFTLANCLVVLVPALGIAAHARLLGRAWWKPGVTTAAGLGMAGVLAVDIAGLPANLGIAIVCGAGAALLLGIAALLAREARQRGEREAVLGAVVAGLTAAGFLTRAVVSAVAGPAAVSPSSSGGGQIAPLVLGALFVVGSSMCFLSLVHARQRDGLLEQARRDALTGVLTRGAFFDRVAAIEARSATEDCSVLMIDADHFKAVNDTHGHRGGDRVLTHIARQIAASVRLSDVVGRYGGEEFCVYLPGCGHDEVARLARRLVDEARQQSVRLDGGALQRYTLSVGHATGHRGASTRREPVDALIERADQALYAAKRAGRDRAVAAPPPGGTPR